MSWPRLAFATVLLALFGAACAGHNGATLSAGASSSEAAASTAAIPSTTSTSVPPTTQAPATTAANADVPAVTAPPAPAPASIEVDYQPHDGATATATLSGPNGSHVKSLDSGAAVFRGLTAGTYSVTITIDTPSGDPNIGAARQIINANDVRVAPGEHSLVACTDDGCTDTR